MLYGAKDVDSVNGINSVDSMSSLKAGNRIKLKNAVDVQNGVAHTQNQASDLAKALIEGIIYLQKL